MKKRTGIQELEEQAALYALGALGSDEATGFEKRLGAGCPLCQSAYEECRGTVAALALGAPDAAPRPELRQRLMERVGIAAPVEKPPSAVGKLVRPDDTPWQVSSPGVEFRPLLGKRTMLVRMSPGSYLPPHEHRYGEQCLVLEGSVRSNDMEAHAGDFTFMPPGSSHSQLYTETGCLLLIAYT
jgi:hypothetical protein